MTEKQWPDLSPEKRLELLQQTSKYLERLVEVDPGLAPKVRPVIEQIQSATPQSNLTTLEQASQNIFKELNE